METRSEPGDYEEPPWVFETELEPEVDEQVEPVAPILGIRGPDIFVRTRADGATRTNRRFLPASFSRRGRHTAEERSRARARANHPCQGSRAIYLVDEEDETTRIELRRAFEGTHGDHLSLVEDSAAS